MSFGFAAIPLPMTGTRWSLGPVLIRWGACASSALRSNKPKKTTRMGGWDTIRASLPGGFIWRLMENPTSWVVESTSFHIMQVFPMCICILCCTVLDIHFAGSEGEELDEFSFLVMKPYCSAPAPHCGYSKTLPSFKKLAKRAAKRWSVTAKSTVNRHCTRPVMF